MRNDDEFGPKENTFTIILFLVIILLIVCFINERENIVRIYQPQTIKDWKQGIRDVFKSKLDCSDDCANNQANAFEDMYRGDDLSDLPTPQECFEAEMQASQQ